MRGEQPLWLTVQARARGMSVSQSYSIPRASSSARTMVKYSSCVGAANVSRRSKRSASENFYSSVSRSLTSSCRSEKRWRTMLRRLLVA